MKKLAFAKMKDDTQGETPKPYKKYLSIALVSMLGIYTLYPTVFHIPGLIQTNSVEEYATVSIEAGRSYNYKRTHTDYHTSEKDFAQSLEKAATAYLDTVVATKPEKLESKEIDRIGVAMSFLAFSPKYELYRAKFAHIDSFSINGYTDESLAIAQRLHYLVAYYDRHSESYTETQLRLMKENWTTIQGHTRATPALTRDIQKTISELTEMVQAEKKIMKD